MAQTQDGCLYSGFGQSATTTPGRPLRSYRDFARHVKDSRSASSPASALNDAFLQSVESFEGSSGDVLAASNYKRSEFEVLCAGPRPPLHLIDKNNEAVQATRARGVARRRS